MEISKNEAQDYLETIRTVQQKTRRAIANGGAPFYLMIWGVVWLIGFLSNQYLSAQVAGQVWAVASAAGVIASFVKGWMMSRSIRRPGLDARVGLFWLAWLVYGFLLVWLSGSSNVTAISLMITVFAMFVYIIMGLWLWRPLAWIGVFVTAVAVAAYLLLPNYVNLIMAWIGGGALFFSGLDMRRHWR